MRRGELRRAIELPARRAGLGVEPELVDALVADVEGETGPLPLLQLRIANSPTGRLGHFVLGFGQDPAGEMYVLTTDEAGPSGTTGKVYRLARPSG